MFEQEIELEKKQSGTLPLLLMTGLIVALVGVTGYFLLESRKVLAPAEAATVVTGILNAQSPPTVSFHTGLVKEGYVENPRDVRYRALEKAGLLKVGKTKGTKAPVTLTAKGSELLKQIPGVKQSKDPDGTEAYVVPLAARKLVEISKIAMNGPERAAVQFEWRWEPNALGESFDAAGSMLAGFKTIDRVQLIDKYGARFYHDAPTKVTISLAKAPQGWQAATE
jgi:hypothetical protein